VRVKQHLLGITVWWRVRWRVLVAAANATAGGFDLHNKLITGLVQ
jgi:hypothetical protein